MLAVSVEDEYSEELTAVSGSLSLHGACICPVGCKPVWRHFAHTNQGAQTRDPAQVGSFLPLHMHPFLSATLALHGKVQQRLPKDK